MQRSSQILIIDDCEDVRFLLALKLKKMGHKVFVAKDAFDGLEILKDDCEINLILIDLVMPNYSGIDLIKTLKENDWHKKLKILCITASKNEALLASVKKYGIAGIIKKPIKNKILRETILTYLPSL